ncbi:MAG: DUF4956 domain-containing protein [Spirochaetales bacterium]|nr:DUF4956 domain-containing protein [Spirochaetales bacterium]
MEIKLLPEMFNLTTIVIPLEQMFLNLLVAIVTSLIISWVYKKTYSGVIYSKNFNITLILVTVVTAGVMMVISGNLALSLGMVGALSIIRFRSAIKDIRDIGYLFWGMAGGLAAGTSNHIIALSSTVIVAILMFLTHYFLGEKFSYLLIIKGVDYQEDQIEEKFKSFSQRYKLKVKNSDDAGKEMIYEVQISKKGEHQFVDQLKNVQGVKTINLLSNKGEILG